MQLSFSALSNGSILLTIILFVVFIILRELLLRQSSKKPLFYYLLLFPGIIFHELSHTIACLITLTRIKSLKLFSKTGGFVIHDKPRFLAISFFISAAPIISGTLVIYFSIRYLHSNSISSMINVSSIFLLYLLSSILITMLPSKQDILNAFSVYLALAIALISYYFLSNNGPIFASINLGLIFCLIVLALINVIIFLINKLLWKFE